MSESLRLPPAPEWRAYDDPLAMALVAEVFEHGYVAVSVEDVIKRAGARPEDFLERFAGKEDCALRTFESVIADFERRIGGAFNEQGEWLGGLRAAAWETADWMAEYPRLVRFGTVEVLAMESEMARVRREGVFIFCAQMIDRGREAAPDPAKVPASAGVVAIGGILQLLTHRLQKGAEIDPHAMVPELMYGVVRVYLGEEAARAELEAARPERPPGP